MHLRRQILLAAIAVLALLPAATRAAPSIGGPFTLQDAAGHVVTEHDFPGRYLLIYFGYTNCPDVCPTTLSQLADALAKLGKRADRIQPIFITVDPARDTPKIVGQYVALFTPRLLGLTGTQAQIDAVTRAYHVYAARRPTGPKPSDYAMDHSSLLYLMAPDGRFIAPITGDADAAKMAAEIAQNLS